MSEKTGWIEGYHGWVERKAGWLRGGETESIGAEEIQATGDLISGIEG